MTDTPLDIPRIRQNLHHPEWVTHWHQVAETGSTNDLARELLAGGTGGTAVVAADCQTRGKGRLGRQWVSPPGSGLYLSLILQPELPAERLAPLTLVAGLAALLALRAHCAKPLSLKWPNDVLAGGRKICGILTEYAGTGPRSGVIVGIGINVNQEPDAFPPPLDRTATSLRIETGSTTDRSDVTASLLNALQPAYRRFVAEGFQPFLDEWTRNSNLFGRLVTVTQGNLSLKGRPERLDESGRLMLRLDSGESLALDAGEVTLS